MHSAHAAAVSGNGTILYSVAFGAEKGPTHTEWWTIGADGNNAKKLEVPDGFHPMGYTRDGQGLYGGWKVNDHQQFAVFALKDGKIASAPTVIVVLPRGVGSASPSPDGKRFAMTADPREPDPTGQCAACAGAGGDEPLRGECGWNRRGVVVQGPEIHFGNDHGGRGRERGGVECGFEFAGGAVAGAADRASRSGLDDRCLQCIGSAAC